MIFKVSEEDKKKSGIYMITNLVNGKYYIGSAVNFYERYRVHKAQFLRGEKNKYFQNAYNKYGSENFEMEIIDIIENLDDLLIIEEMYIINLFAYDSKNGYNALKSGYSNAGYKHTEETKLHLSKINKERCEKLKLDPDYIEKRRLIKELNILKKEEDKKIKEQIKQEKELEKIKIREQNCIIKKEKFLKEFEIRMKKRNPNYKLLILNTASNCNQCKNEVLILTKQSILKFRDNNYLCLDCLKYNSKIKNMNKPRRSKLTINDVIEIKKLLKQKNILQKDIALMFNVKAPTINSINTGKNWNHIN